MEIEVNRKRLFLIVGILALIILAAVLAPRLNRSPVRATEALATATPTPAHQKVVANVDITLNNQSQWQVEGWDECLPKLQTWIGEQYPLQRLTVVITDTVSPDMVIGVKQTEGSGPDAAVKGKYEKTEDGLTLTIAVTEGESGDKLDVALTVETALLVQEYARPKTRAAWNNHRNGLEQFRPLISKEKDQWISQCLHLAR